MGKPIIPHAEQRERSPEYITDYSSDEHKDIKRHFDGDVYITDGSV